MKRLAGILLVAGSLLGIRQAYAQELPPDYRPVRTADIDFTRKAHEAARELLFGEPAQFSLQWLREEVDPLLRARRRLRQTMQARSEQQQSLIARQHAPKRDLNKEVGIWRMSIGNTSVSNWSPFPDRALDARTLSFPIPRDSKADKRTEPQKALDKMRQQRK